MKTDNNSVILYMKAKTASPQEMQAVHVLPFKNSSAPKAESTRDMYGEIRKRCGGERSGLWFTVDERQGMKIPENKPVILPVI